MTSIIRLRDFCRAERAWLLDAIAALVRLESPTTDKAAVDRCGAELARRLDAIGARVTRLPQTERGDHIRGEFVLRQAQDESQQAQDESQQAQDESQQAQDESRQAQDEPRRAQGDALRQPEGERPRQILLLGHFDTVWPIGQLDRMPLVERDGRLHGPGVFDMKAGIAIAMLAARAVLETSSGTATADGRPLRIVMLWTSDEEIGSGTSRLAIEAEARRSDAVLVLEPSLPGGALKTSRKGCGAYEVVVHGVSAHAGIEPEKGASAVEELARQILRINALQDLARGITVNVVQISGGLRSNVIPDEARASVDVRVPTAEAAAEVAAAFRGLTPVDPRTRVEAHGGFDRPPLERSPQVVGLFELACRVASELGQPLGEGATGGGSDGNFTAALGVPTLDGLGAVGDGAHALREHVLLDTLADRAALVAGLIRSI